MHFTLKSLKLFDFWACPKKPKAQTQLLSSGARTKTLYVVVIKISSGAFLCPHTETRPA